MFEFDRTDPAYHDAVLSQANDIGVTPVSICTDRPPESWAELQAMVAAGRHPGNPISEEVDGIMAIIGSSENPDELARQLPFDDLYPQNLLFVLPDIELVRRKLSKGE